MDFLQSLSSAHFMGKPAWRWLTPIGIAGARPALGKAPLVDLTGHGISPWLLLGPAMDAVLRPLWKARLRPAGGVVA